MTLDTKITYADPEVTITVDDDGGGDKRHKVELIVSWDPRYLEYKSLKPRKGSKVVKATGYCLWLGQNVPATGKKFKVSLESKGKGDAWVCAASLDRSKGQAKGAAYQVLNKKPQPRKKGRKKGRKKA